MAHAIITGDPSAFGPVRIRLEMLGLTVGEVADPRGTSVGDCDLVVHVATARHSDVPHRPSGELPPAPLLCLGASPTTAWTAVDSADLETEVFATAVRVCVDRAWELRRRPAPEAPPERYRDFLSHELRSPLSVVATALRALAESVDDPEVERSLVERALRNVQRLERTVDWSQRNLLLLDAPPVQTLRIMSVEDLCECLSHLGVCLPEQPPVDFLVETDPEVLAAVIQQTVRAYECLSSDLEIGLSLVADSRGCRVRVEAPAVADLTPRVARIGLVRPGDAQGRDELSELAALLVPPVALEGLAARLVVDEAASGVLEIDLPVAAAPIPA